MDMPIYLPRDLRTLDDEPDYLPSVLSALNELLWEFFFGHITHRHHLPVLTSQAAHKGR